MTTDSSPSQPNGAVSNSRRLMSEWSIPVASSRAASSWVSGRCCRTGRSRCRPPGPRRGRWPAARSRVTPSSSSRPATRVTVAGAPPSTSRTSPKPGLLAWWSTTTEVPASSSRTAQLAQAAGRGGVEAHEHVRRRRHRRRRHEPLRAGQPAQRGGQRERVGEGGQHAGAATAQPLGEGERAAERVGVGLHVPGEDDGRARVRGLGQDRGDGAAGRGGRGEVTSTGSGVRARGRRPAERPAPRPRRRRRRGSRAGRRRARRRRCSAPRRSRRACRRRSGHRRRGLAAAELRLALTRRLVRVRVDFAHDALLRLDGDVVDILIGSRGGNRASSSSSSSAGFR